MGPVEDCPRTHVAQQHKCNTLSGGDSSGPGGGVIQKGASVAQWA